MYQTSTEILTTPCKVMFEARDAFKTSEYSQVNFIVRGVEFTADREMKERLVTLQSSRVLIQIRCYCKTVKGDIKLNDTVVGPDGLWKMDITSSALDSDGTFEIYFEQDGQSIGKDDGTSITLKKGESVTEGNVGLGCSWW